jgi:hypothetical protein
MLHIVIVAVVFKRVSDVFSSVLEACSSVSIVFRHMLQTLFFDVSKVDQVLYHLLLPSFATSFLQEPADIHANEGWVMGVGQGSWVRLAQGRKLCTTNAASGSEMGAGLERGCAPSLLVVGRERGCVRHGWEQGRGDMGAASVLFNCTDFYFDFT